MGPVKLDEALYRALIGKRYDPFTISVSGELIGGYAAIGDRNPLRYATTIARAAGYRDVVAPPTLGFTLTLLAHQSDLALAELGYSMNDALHGEQTFTYGAPICAGDILTGAQHIADVRTKKQGTLLFLATEFQIDNQQGERALEMTQISIVPLVRPEH
jgi:acyl dehydratase